MVQIKELYLHAGALRETDQTPVLIFAPIHLNYDPYSTLQLGLNLRLMWACEGHSFDFRDPDRPAHCPNYLRLNQDSSINICVGVLCLVLGFFFNHPSRNSRSSDTVNYRFPEGITWKE